LKKKTGYMQNTIYPKWGISKNRYTSNEVYAFSIIPRLGYNRNYASWIFHDAFKIGLDKITTFLLELYTTIHWIFIGLVKIKSK
jgi:hypothetical protein